ncbi:MAG TPA: PilZ domain-containing protein [bacterium]
MQERRSTVRLSREGRAHYCPSDDLLPRDGRLSDVSEHGVRLRTREAHEPGQRITVSLALPDDPEPFTATGTIRWSQTASGRRGWYDVGAEWLPLDAPVAGRLRAYAGRADGPDPQPGAPRAPAWVAGSALRRWAAAGALLALAAAAVWLMRVGQENRELARAISQRDQVIGQLEQQSGALHHQLAQARDTLTITAQVVERLEVQGERLQTQLGELSAGLDQVQDRYAGMLAARESLLQEVTAIEEQRNEVVTVLNQEREDTARRMSSVPELRRAIREAITARRAASARARREAAASARASEDRSEEPPEAGTNRGYLVWEGAALTSQPAESARMIRVLEPEVAR